MVFAVVRMIPQAHAKLIKGEWDKKSFTGVRARRQDTGASSGWARSASTVAMVLQGAGMTVIACDPFLSPEVAKELRIESVSMDQLVARADVITLHTPLTEQTAT